MRSRNIFILCIGILLALFLAAFVVSTLGAKRVDAMEKETVKRTIAIVYDNSGSMFHDDKKDSAAWCQAQYAMEIFASMMNQGDTLMIYPMHPITIGKTGTVAYSYENNPWIITNDSDKPKIRDIYSDNMVNSDTPIESIDAAANGLKTATGEKWLIVLTDGKTFNLNGNGLSPEDTKKALEEKFRTHISGMNILYLGIGTDIKKPSINPSNSNTYVAETSTSANVPEVLTELCNIIFGRDALPAKNFNNSTVEFDVPLSKLYIFIQGENIGNVKLSSGSTALSSSKSFQPSYGTFGRKTSAETKGIPDTTLKGYIAVYENVPAGKYTYSFSGTKSSIAYYYEPNVDLRIKLTDSQGNEIADTNSLAPGDYNIEYYISDASGNKVESDLLGNTSYHFEYTQNGTTQTHTNNRAGKMPISIKDGDTFKLDLARVELLSGYKIEKRGSQLGFLSGTIKGVKVTVTGFGVALTGVQPEYSIKELDGLVFKVKVTKDGKQLSAADLKNVKLNATVGGGLSCEAKQSGDGFDVTLKAPNLENVKVGDNKITVTATYESSTEAATSATDEKTFKVVYEKVDFDIKLTPNTDSYLVNEVDKAEYFASFSLNGTALTGAALDKVTFSAEITSGLTVKTAKETNGYRIILEAPANPADIKVGTYKLTANATYKSETTEPTTRSAEISFTVDYQKIDFKLELSGGAENYDADKVDNATYNVKFYLDGAALTGAALDSITAFNVDVTPGLTAEAIKENDGYRIVLHAPADINDITIGDNKLTVTAVYKTDATEPVSRTAEADFKVKSVTDSLTVSLSKINSYYSVKEFKEFKGIVATIKLNGEPLTAEQFAQLQFTAEAGNIRLNLEPLPDKSQYVITADANQNIAAGHYTLKVNASGLNDRMGNPIYDSKSDRFELGLIPVWLRTLIIILSILLLILLIIFILTRPALPKKIDLAGASVIVNGSTIKNHKTRLTYLPKHGQKRTIKVTSNISSSNKVGFSVRVVPAKGSMLITPSAQRRAEILPNSVSSINGINNLTINKQFESNGKKLQPIGAKEIKNNFSLPKSFTFSGMKNVNGVKSNYLVTGQIKIK